MQSWRKTALIIFVMLELLGCGYEHVVERQAGDAKITDYGFLAYYPRYRVEFPLALISPELVSKFSLTALPREDYALRMVILIEGISIVDRREWDRIWTHLDNTRATAEVELFGANSSIHRFAGRLTRDWIPSVGSADAYFRVPSLEQLDLSGSVTLNLRLSAERDLPAAIALKPVLLAGGIRI